jgi:hypothetical protein
VQKGSQRQARTRPRLNKVPFLHTLRSSAVVDCVPVSCIGLPALYHSSLFCLCLFHFLDWPLPIPRVGLFLIYDTLLYLHKNFRCEMPTKLYIAKALCKTREISKTGKRVRRSILVPLSFNTYYALSIPYQLCF